MSSSPYTRMAADRGSAETSPSRGSYRSTRSTGRAIYLDLDAISSDPVHDCAERVAGAPAGGRDWEANAERAIRPRPSGGDEDFGLVPHQVDRLARSNPAAAEADPAPWTTGHGIRTQLRTRAGR